MSKHTTGPWIFDGVDGVIAGYARVCTVYGAACPDQPGHANMRLICEAGNVCKETGLTPRQLADQRRELLEALRKCLTKPGAACWKSREFAEKRIGYIDQIARVAIDFAEQ